MTRRVVETSKINREREKLMIVTVYEEGMNKESIKRDNPLSKKHHVLVSTCGRYEFK